MFLLFSMAEWRWIQLNFSCVILFSGIIYLFICFFFCREFFFDLFFNIFFFVNRIPPIYFSFSAFSTFLKISFRCLLFYFPRSCKRLFIYLFYIFISFLLSFCSGSAFVFFHGILFKTFNFFFFLCFSSFVYLFFLF